MGTSKSPGWLLLKLLPFVARTSFTRMCDSIKRIEITRSMERSTTLRRYNNEYRVWAIFANGSSLCCVRIWQIARLCLLHSHQSLPWAKHSDKISGSSECKPFTKFILPLRTAILPTGSKDSEPFRLNYLIVERQK